MESKGQNSVYSHIHIKHTHTHMYIHTHAMPVVLENSEQTNKV